MGDAKPKLIKYQKNMAVVLVALAGPAAAAVYYFGWRALAVLAIANLAAFATELFFTRRRGEPVTLAVFVSGTLSALIMPPTIPLWIAALAMVVGITFGKELFGGFGRNVYNPALVGRAFVFVGFPHEMTGEWVSPFTGGLGGLGGWISDAVTAATPLKEAAGGASIDLAHLVLGARAGCLGETSIVLIALGALFMLYKKVAAWKIMIPTLASFAGFSALFYAMGWGAPLDPVSGFMLGGMFFAAVFMATDPVSAPMVDEAKIAYGVLIGFTAVLIRYMGNFPEGAMFAVLIGNTFGPIMEEGIKHLKSLRAGKAEAPAAGKEGA